MPKPVNGPMPGISPAVSDLVNRPSIMLVMVVVHSLVLASPPMYIVHLPLHVPTALARCSWFGPGWAAAMQACMSASLMPAGGAGWSPFAGGWPLVSLLGAARGVGCFFAGCAEASEARPAPALMRG